MSGVLLAALTCPCHLPILPALQVGTMVGAFIGDHWGVAAMAMAALFFLLLMAVKKRAST